MCLRTHSIRHSELFSFSEDVASHHFPGPGPVTPPDSEQLLTVTEDIRPVNACAFVCMVHVDGERERERERERREREKRERVCVCATPAPLSHHRARENSTRLGQVCIFITVGPVNKL